METEFKWLVAEDDWEDDDNSDNNDESEDDW